MKTTIEIDITTPDKYEMIFPEEGETIEDYKGRMKELTIFQSDFAHAIHKDLVEKAKMYFLDEMYFEEQWIDDLEELWVEGWDSFDDYKIRINVK